MYFTIEERIEVFRSYYNRKNNRPLLGFFLGSEYPLHRYRAAGKLPTNRPIVPEDVICRDYLTDYERLFTEYASVGGGFIWAASAFWGIPWLEAALGCEIWADIKTGSVYSVPPDELDDDPDLIEFSLSNKWIKKLVEFLVAITKHSQARYPLATTRMRGIADLLMALYGNEKFIYKMLEEPKKTGELCEKLTDFWVDFGKIQLEHIPEFHGGVGSFYYSIWAPKKSVWLQEDAAAFLNPKLYEEFILPCDKRIADTFEGCFIHLHPTGFYPYRQLLDTSVTVLELHIDNGGPSAQTLYPVYRDILAKNPLLIWGKISQNELDWVFKNLSPQGLAINVAVEGLKEAKTIWHRYFGSG
ncbi:MAG: hypothetical protein ABIG61_07025 [Planctomycetota bacterium]